jgi:hypothetical protein
MSTQEYFERHILKGDGCWIWTGALSNNGYGQFRQSGRTRSAHRVAHEMYIGPIPDGLTIDHTCHNADESCDGGSCRHRRCVNPEHLEAVAQGENSKRAARDKCPKGHEYTPENTRRRKDNGRRICVACDLAWRQSRYVGYGKPGRPSNAARAALTASRLPDTG